VGFFLKPFDTLESELLLVVLDAFFDIFLSGAQSKPFRAKSLCWTSMPLTIPCTGHKNELFLTATIARLLARVQSEFAALERRIQQGELQSPCRSVVQFEYATLKSWSRARGVIGKAEILPQGRDSPEARTRACANFQLQVFSHESQEAAQSQKRSQNPHRNRQAPEVQIILICTNTASEPNGIVRQA
jgi:hypothetical protein